MEKALLSMENITKIYGNGIIANKDVNFSIREGEIHALMGENGAGKSTLMKILFGEEQPDSGNIVLNGKTVKIGSPTEALNQGIGMVHQHFMLVPSLTVAENIFLGMEPVKRGILNRAQAEKRTAELAEKYNFKLNPKAKISEVSVGTKQKVEILKALARGVQILILDEPTAVLTPQETEELFHELLQFKKNGQTIIFISHKLKEIKQICDRITIMKKGFSMGTYDLADMDEADISRLMIGHDVAKNVEKTPAVPGSVMLEMKKVACHDEGKAVLDQVSLRLRQGEILGVAGVEGNGQQELAECIAGVRRASGGEILVDGKNIIRKSIHEIREMGISYLSDDRIAEGTSVEESIESNLVADKLNHTFLVKGPFLKKKEMERFAEEQIEKYQIVCDSPKVPVAMLSGGNMQKVVVAREFSGEPRVMIVNQPTRGVDVGAMEFIHRKLVELRDQKAAVLLISADLTELMGLSDSLIVMYNGRITAYFEDVTKVTEEEVGFYMLGVKTQSREDIERRLLHE